MKTHLHTKGKETQGRAGGIDRVRLKGSVKIGSFFPDRAPADWKSATQQVGNLRYNAVTGSNRSCIHIADCLNQPLLVFMITR
jgi:hypothetical protein